MTGTAPLSYQWQINGKDLPGQASTNLDLASLTSQQAGEYRLIASNAVGTKASAPAVVQVHMPIGGAFNTGVQANGSLAAEIIQTS